ncbi:MAG: RNA polymerase sigma factor [Runella zeae]
MKHHDLFYIDKVLKGDTTAFAFLVDKYKHMVYTIALKISDNEADAEDIAQESFVKAYRQLHTFEGKSKFSTWLYTIAYRTALAQLQENTIDTAPITEEIADTYAPDPLSSSLEANEQQRYVREAIQRLPKIEALLVTLYYLEENSVKEIQEITGLTAENIKIRLFRARKKLEQWLRFLL